MAIPPRPQRQTPPSPEKGLPLPPLPALRLTLPTPLHSSVSDKRVGPKPGRKRKPKPAPPNKPQLARKKRKKARAAAPAPKPEPTERHTRASAKRRGPKPGLRTRSTTGGEALSDGIPTVFRARPKKGGAAATPPKKRPSQIEFRDNWLAMKAQHGDDYQPDEALPQASFIDGSGYHKTYRLGETVKAKWGRTWQEATIFCIFPDNTVHLRWETGVHETNSWGVAARNIKKFNGDHTPEKLRERALYGMHGRDFTGNWEVHKMATRKNAQGQWVKCKCNAGRAYNGMGIKNGLISSVHVSRAGDDLTAALLLQRTKGRKAKDRQIQVELRRDPNSLTWELAEQWSLDEAESQMDRLVWSKGRETMVWLPVDAPLIKLETEEAGPVARPIWNYRQTENYISVRSYDEARDWARLVELNSKVTREMNRSLKTRTRAYDKSFLRGRTQAGAETARNWMTLSATLNDEDWPAGFVMFHRHIAKTARGKAKQWVEVFWLFVDKKRRGLGIGSCLIRALLCAAVARWKVYEFKLHVYQKNVCAIKMYESLGFTQTTVKENYERGTTAVRMYLKV